MHLGLQAEVQIDGEEQDEEQPLIDQISHVL